MRNHKYKPASHSENRMKHESDVANARAHYFNDPPLNLRYLLEKRYGWMNAYIKNEDHGIEVGCGTGLSKLFIKCRNYRITDNTESEWLDDKMVNALNTPYESESLDFVISSNVIHHLPHSMAFFKEMNRILKPNGVIIIQEVNASWCMRRILRLMRNSGYDYNINVFDEKGIPADTGDLGSPNYAIPNLLFDNLREFEKNVPYFKMERNSFSELFLFLNSGGVSTRSKYLRLPGFLLKLVNKVDDLLVSIAPHTFALQRQVVLRKK